MADVWPLLLLFLLGVGLCLLVGWWIVRRWSLPMRQALIYFGLLPHPDEVALPPKPSRRELARRRQRADQRIQRSRTRQPQAPPATRQQVGPEGPPTRRTPRRSRTGGDQAA